MADWKDVFKEAVAAAAGKVGGKGAGEFLQTAAAAHKRSLESVLAAFTDGKIDEETLNSELADEKRVLRAELLAAQPISKKGARDATSAFFAVIDDALSAGIGGFR